MTLSIIETIEDPKLFEPWFAGASWDAWKAVLRAIYTLSMSASDRDQFRALTDRDPPTRQPREVWIIAGRRAGKDSVASVIAAHAAAFFDPKGKLRGGERACVLCLACDRDQSRIVLNYIRSYFTDIPMLRDMVRGERADGLGLANGVDIVVATNSYRSIRGRSVLCAIFDEVAYWRSETSVAPDVETYHAVVPGLATLPNSVLIGISTPYKKSGLLYDKWRQHYGSGWPNGVTILPSSWTASWSRSRSTLA